LSELESLARLAPATIALLPADAPFSPQQRAWLNGFFAGLLTHLAKRTVDAPAVRLPVAVLYASQTGTAERLAKKLAKEARAKGFDAQPRELGAMSLADVAALEHAVIVAATHGEGEPPDSAVSLAEQLATATPGVLAGLRYAVLALGDRTYTKFCEFGRHLDERFAALGATRLVDRAEADNDVEAAFDAFRASLWPRLAEQRPAAASLEAASTAAQAEEDDEAEERWTRKNPFAARLLHKDALTRDGSDKEVRHIVLSLAGSDLHYEPGDALGVWPRNAPALVDALLSLCALPADSPVELSGGSLTLREALSTRLEIAKLNAATAIRFSALADDAELLALVEPGRAADLESYLYGRDALDLLARKPAAIGDAQALANLFPLLTPRLYSIASSLAAHPQEVHLTASVVRHARDGRPRGGVASTDFADRIDIDQTVPVYVHRNTRFRLPADPGTPIVMIGPGTGIAPFRSFLWQRKAHGYTGRTWLFFGDRHAHSDFLYQQELEAFIDDGTLVRLDTAFSRDQHEKVYVQHRILQAGAELWSWIADGAVIYVCGDATHMAKDVDAALRRLFVEHGRLSDANAQLELRGLAASGRYVRDVY
jgi:sulfite reductase (NADPH) flavoprotein alpha-component